MKTLSNIHSFFQTRKLPSKVNRYCKMSLLSWILVRTGSESATSGWGSFWERSLFVPSFSLFEFWDVSGTASEWTRACGLKRNLSSLDRAPKLRLSVLLNSRDSFFCHFTLNFLRHLSNVIFLHSRTRVPLLTFWDDPHDYTCWWLRTFFHSSKLSYLTREK